VSRYRVIKTVDLAGDEEFLVTPEPTLGEIEELDLEQPEWPYWFDSDRSWGAWDFNDPAIYASVEEFIVDVPGGAQ
jgi:hypothetical protein